MSDKELSDMIKQHIEEFLKNGGKVTVCPPQAFACTTEGTVRKAYRTKKSSEAEVDFEP